MTEEGHRLHGMNGNADSNIKEECHKANYGHGGRLKFFKDGKFILELERAREGERVSWVSVPRKTTFWPPQGTASSTAAYRLESSTSLSGCILQIHSLYPGLSVTITLFSVSDDNSSIQSSPWQRDHSWKQTAPCRNISKEMMLTSAKDRKKSSKKCLLVIVQNLIDRNFRTSTPPRAETVVSPRKRFLREMEKDKMQVEDNCQKRVETSLRGITACQVESPVLANGIEDTKPPRNCSYSITSLLAEDRNIKRSPSNSPSHYSPMAPPQYCSPPPPTTGGTQRAWTGYDPSNFPGYPPYAPRSLTSGRTCTRSRRCPPYYGAGVYNRGYLVPPMYHTPMQVPLRHETPSCSWTVEPARDGDHRGGRQLQNQFGVTLLPLETTCSPLPCNIGLNLPADCTNFAHFCTPTFEFCMHFSS
ncbi:hypothetical protein NQ317_016185 [Molorchus minor]|uniref:Uncharacterized protein n=1 Tax=Molorchus minor TaxID=1323400 RepID=A0ABQ9IZS8_9CUCU|nr:hypothetical protein NQ317_016185 [Molorchus minor]